jgi:hypothetical protein
MTDSNHQNSQSQTEIFEKVLASYLPQVNKILEKYLPRTFTQESLERITGKASYTLDIESATKSLLVPIWDILDRGGKRWRPVLGNCQQKNVLLNLISDFRFWDFVIF